MHVTFMLHVKTSSANIQRLLVASFQYHSRTPIVANTNLCSRIILCLASLNTQQVGHSSDLHIDLKIWSTTPGAKLTSQRRVQGSLTTMNNSSWPTAASHIYGIFRLKALSLSVAKQWSHTMRRLSDPMQLLTSSLLRVNLDVSTDAHTPTRSSEAAIQEAVKRYRLQFH